MQTEVISKLCTFNSTCMVFSRRTVSTIKLCFVLFANHLHCIHILACVSNDTLFLMASTSSQEEVTMSTILPSLLLFLLFFNPNQPLHHSILHTSPMLFFFFQFSAVIIHTSSSNTCICVTFNQTLKENNVESLKLFLSQNNTNTIKVAGAVRNKKMVGIYRQEKGQKEIIRHA